MAASKTARDRLAGGLLAAAVVLAAAIIVASFFGGSFRPFDSLAHFRAHVGVILALFAIAALVGRRWKTAALAVGGGALGLATTLPLLLPTTDEAEGPSGQPVYTLLQMNLRFDTIDKAEAISRIAEARPDVVTVQEVTKDWEGLFANLQEMYPYQAFCGTDNRDGNGILSRRPFAQSDANALCRPRFGLISRDIDFNGQVVSLSSLHLEWPWPKSHWWQIDGMGPLLHALPQPSLLAGDFNAAPWSAAVRTIAGNGGWRVVPGIGQSWMGFSFGGLPARPFGLPIDNVLASPEIAILSIGTLAPTQSDHLPVLVRFTVARPAAPPPVAVVSR